MFERTCNICNSNETENEIQFLFRFSFYHALRQTLLNKATEIKTFFLWNYVEKLRHVVEKHFIYVAKFIVDAMKRRKSVLYN